MHEASAHKGNFVVLWRPEIKEASTSVKEAKLRAKSARCAFLDRMLVVEIPGTELYNPRETYQFHMVQGHTAAYIERYCRQDKNCTNKRNFRLKFHAAFHMWPEDTMVYAVCEKTDTRKYYGTTEEAKELQELCDKQYEAPRGFLIGKVISGLPVTPAKPELVCTLGSVELRDTISDAKLIYASQKEAVAQVTALAKQFPGRKYFAVLVRLGDLISQEKDKQISREVKAVQIGMSLVLRCGALLQFPSLHSFLPAAVARCSGSRQVNLQDNVWIVTRTRVQHFKPAMSVAHKTCPAYQVCLPKVAENPKKVKKAKKAKKAKKVHTKVHIEVSTGECTTSLRDELPLEITRFFFGE